MRGVGDKRKIFRDATQGYIQIPSDMVTNLVDIFEVQRLKDVAQTGIRPIYSGATHDRFSHSIGVYNIGTKIYEKFQENLLRNFDRCVVDTIYKDFVKSLLVRYEEFYHAACILHDIGHPALSHTFEYIYDNRYLPLQNTVISVGGEEIKRLYEAHRDKKRDTPLCIGLKEKMIECSKGSILANEIHASQHEMMGAYLILTDESVQNSIKMYLSEEISQEDYAFLASMIVGAQYVLPQIDVLSADTERRKERLEVSLKNCIIRLLNGMIDADSIDYLNRNTHFAGYSTAQIDVVRLCNAFSAHFDINRWIFEPCMEKSAMSALEGFISARNYEPRWLYSHHKIVYHEAFLVKYLYKISARLLYALDQPRWDGLCLDELNNRISVYGINVTDISPLTWAESMRDFYAGLVDKCLKDSVAKETLTEYFKNAITEDIDNVIPEDKKVEFVNADDKISVGFDVLFRQYAHLKNSFSKVPKMQEFCFANALLEVKKQIDSNERSVSDCLNASKTIFDSAKEWVSFYEFIRDGYFVYLMSPVGKFQWPSRELISYKTSDSDINAIFKQMYLRYKDIAFADLSEAEKEVIHNSEDIYDMYKSAMVEYHTRRYRQSLWKTEEEYTLFLEDVGKQTGLSKREINDIFVNYIVENAYRVEFDDPGSFRKADRRKQKVVYLNWGDKPGRGQGGQKEKFSRLFSCFGKEMVICIYGFHYKDFGKLKIRFDAGSTSKLVSYSELVGNTKREDEYLPYIYFETPEEYANNKKVWTENLGEKLKKNLVAYLLDTNKGEVMNTNSFQAKRGKIIRDAVHGDIFVPERFLEVVDSKAFQRLRRIKQLSTADYVFPEANHTRFAHSLGTFHIMMLMMERICALFDYLHIDYTQDDRDVILMAALLHDIGHGPYSHAFEKLSGSGKSHEEWTREIIENEPELKGILSRNFRPDFAISVSNCLKAKKEDVAEAGTVTLQNVFSMLISSQLDADRLDYLVRDSDNTGVKLGVVDLQKIISSLELTMHNDKLSVCISEDALSAVEQLIVGRYNMYDSVYFSPYKAFSEELMCKIVERISEDPNIPSDSLFGKIRNEQLSLEDYIRLDDSVFQSELYSYQQKSCDPITKEMITNFFNRSGYNRLRILHETPPENSEFIREVEKKLGIRVEQVYGIIHRVAKYSAYDGRDEDSILIVGKNGVVANLNQRSKIVGRPDGNNNELWDTTKSFIYVNYDILRMDKDLFGRPIDVKKLEELVDSYSLRKHTEIEEKYSCDQEIISRAKDVDTVFNNPKMAQYEIANKPETKEQEDVYFDTADYFLARSEASFRRRKIAENSYVYTVKQSIDPNNRENGGQFIRSEYELSATDGKRDETVREFMRIHLSDLFEKKEREFDPEQLMEQITVKNVRTSYDVFRKDSDFSCEVSLDTVTYCYNNLAHEDWQIEIELKSLSPIHRVELKSFAENFKEVIGLESEKKETLSKYEKALKQFNLC